MPDDLIAEGRRRERADVVAYLTKKIGVSKRTGERGDDGAALLAQRLAALTASIEAAVHEGEAEHG